MDSQTISVLNFIVEWFVPVLFVAIAWLHLAAEKGR